MILSKSRGNGNQLLKPETVAMTAQNRIGNLVVTKMSAATPIYPDMVCRTTPGVLTYSLKASNF